MKHAQYTSKEVEGLRSEVTFPEKGLNFDLILHACVVAASFANKTRRTEAGPLSAVVPISLFAEGRSKLP